jgi:hypothetical protein
MLSSIALDRAMLRKVIFSGTIIFIGFPPVICDQSHENARQETCHANLPFIVSPQGNNSMFGETISFSRSQP